MSAPTLLIIWSLSTMSSVIVPNNVCEEMGANAVRAMQESRTDIIRYTCIDASSRITAQLSSHKNVH